MATPKAFKIKMECKECHGMFSVVFRLTPGGKYHKGPKIVGTMRVHSRADRLGGYNCKGGNATIPTSDLSNANFQQMLKFFHP